MQSSVGIVGKGKFIWLIRNTTKRSQSSDEECSADRPQLCVKAADALLGHKELRHQCDMGAHFAKLDNNFRSYVMCL